MRTYKKDYLDERDLSQYPTLALRLRKGLNAKSMTLNKLSEITGISGSVLKNYTEKDVDVGYKNLEKIANALSVSIDYLLGRSNAATANEEVSAICAYTGLSAKAIESLHKATSTSDRLEAYFKNEVITNLLESSNIESLCISIKDYFLKAELAQEAFDDALKGLVPRIDVYTAEKEARYAQYEATERLKLLMDETYKIPSMYAFEMMSQMAKSKEAPNGEYNETQK